MSDDNNSSTGEGEETRYPTEDYPWEEAKFLTDLFRQLGDSGCEQEAMQVT